METARNRMAAASRVLAISDALRRGEELTIADVQEACGVKYPQARAYLKVIEDTQPVETKWHDTSGEGRGVKVWHWPTETYKNDRGARR